jgi:ABC-type bacteriocin/lantibiotic exporter with double-glycine peptidase domain
MYLRAATSTIVYCKSVRLSETARRTTNVGEITNLMSSDARRLQDTTTFLQTLWSAPLQIIISLVLLYRLLGPASLTGLACMILMIPLNLLVTRWEATYQTELMEIKDVRVNSTNESLNWMRLLKFFAWEVPFREKIEAIRAQELAKLFSCSLMSVISAFSWTLTPILVSVATFTTFVLLGHELSNQIIFPAIAIFNILRFPVTMFPMVISSVISAKVSCERLQNFLLQPERQSLTDAKTISRSVRPPNTAPIEFQQASLAWEDGAQASQASLRDITLRVEPGTLVVVVGMVGSGKSSLLSGLLGDMYRVSGTVAINGEVAMAGKMI